jgi:ribosomal protein S18
VIQGDGIDHAMIVSILDAMTERGWSADNVAFGSGGALLPGLLIGTPLGLAIGAGAADAGAAEASGSDVTDGDVGGGDFGGGFGDRGRKKGLRCRFCREQADYVDYKDLQAVTKQCTAQGKLFSRKRSGNCAKHMRMV